MRCAKRQNLEKRKRSFSQEELQSNIHIPAWDIRSGMTTRHGFPGREVQGRGFQSSTKLCIIVHAFLTTLYPFSLFSSMECKLCSKSNKPLKPLDLRGFEDGSREVI